MMLFAPKDQLQIVTNFEAIIGIKILIQPIIGVIFVLCKDVKKTQMGLTFFCTAVHTNTYTTIKLLILVKIMLADQAIESTPASSPKNENLLST